MTRSRASADRGLVCQTVTRRSGSGNGSGRRKSAQTALNMVVVAAIPTANVRITRTENPGDRSTARHP